MSQMSVDSLPEQDTGKQAVGAGHVRVTRGPVRMQKTFPPTVSCTVHIPVGPFAVSVNDTPAFEV